MRSALPIALCLLLLALSFAQAGLLQDYQRARQVHRRLQSARARLEAVKAQSLAATLEERNYQALIEEFAEVTRLSERARRVSKGEVDTQVAQLVDGVTRGLEEEPFASSDEKTFLVFRSVSPGERQEFPPYLSVDFEINLEGRFFALPDFLALISHVAEEQQCTVSIGKLQLTPIPEAPIPGSLQIKLPLRAYFYEQ